MSEPKITKIEQVSFGYEIQDMGTDYNGFNQVYEKGAVRKSGGSILRIHTDIGVTGETPGAIQPTVARYLLGRNPFEREKIYNDLKRGLRHTDRTGMNSPDIALWDFAGKVFDAPIYRLLGGYKKSIPAYASTYHGDDNGGLSTPEAFADFAAHCVSLGYPAFKIHGWGNGPMRREIDTVLETRKRVGDEIDLMIDPACEYETWADALRIGRACDDAKFFWLEDPYKDGGVSIFAHRKLRELIKTPLLQTEHIFGLEQHVDFIVNGGTDFVRVGTYEDGGITGAMKVAHAAEGFGLDVEFHGGGLAHRHCIAAVRNTNYYELGLLHPNIATTKPPIYPPEFTDELTSVDSNGHVIVPQGPGLGVELDWDYINANHTGTTVYE
ncbi:mandelate racemase [Candidatus Poribacteria bacterium]|jgi:L-alanine-DL-glutamate epimerase-like enolase superfamily enzyme|nr:mandelate racemase [Candidatus Poribacteria bacterium]MBT5533350.1 mandelate racemase [Candidatus Poribacteria bacterium]MBT5713257.1 mandelate racemase [Candidatus Poribacteria bacterium]MBT7806998.1 mandelate racemase [Candidatus Poribacteria bacterium]